MIPSIMERRRLEVPVGRKEAPSKSSMMMVRCQMRRGRRRRQMRKRYRCKERNCDVFRRKQHGPIIFA